MADGAARSGILRAFASPAFRVFWVGHAAQIMGVWVNRVALGWLTWQLTGSTAWLGVIGAASMLPTVFVGPITGAIADRFGHRKQVVLGTSGSATCGLAIALLTLTHLITIEMVLGLVIVGGFSRAFSVPARAAIVPLLVPRKDISAATGVIGSTFHTGFFVGPALGGAIIAGFGAAAGILFYAFCFYLNAVLLALIRLPEEPPRRGKGGNLLTDVAAGFRYTVGHEGLRSVMMLSGIVSIFLQPFLDMLPSFADQIFHRGASGLAMLTSAAGLGAMCTGIWIAHRGRTEGLVRLIFAMLMGGIAGLVVFSQTGILEVALAALFFAGATLVAINVCGISLIQNGVDPGFRARVISFNSMITISGPSLGSIAIGWAATWAGVQAPVTASALLALLCVLAMGRRTINRAAQLEAVGT